VSAEQDAVAQEGESGAAEPSFGQSPTRRRGLLITAHLPAFCADVVWIPMKVKATQIRLIWTGRAARHVRLATRPEGLLWAWWVGPQLAGPA